LERFLLLLLTLFLFASSVLLLAGLDHEGLGILVLTDSPSGPPSLVWVFSRASTRCSGIPHGSSLDYPGPPGRFNFTRFIIFIYSCRGIGFFFESDFSSFISLLAGMIPRLDACFFFEWK
jgi:hypothetical protein